MLLVNQKPLFFKCFLLILFLLVCVKSAFIWLILLSHTQICLIVLFKPDYNIRKQLFLIKNGKWWNGFKESFFKIADSRFIWFIMNKNAFKKIEPYLKITCPLLFHFSFLINEYNLTVYMFLITNFKKINDSELIKSL